MSLLGLMCTCWQMLIVYLMEYCVEIRHLEVRTGPFYVLLILQSWPHLSHHVGQILVMIKYTATVLLRVHGLPFVCCRYYTDPSGTYWQCNAKAIGSGSEGADSSLQEQYNKV